MPNGEYTKNHEETYKHLLNFHFPNCKEVNEVIHSRIRYSFAGAVDLDLVERITTKDCILWAINTFIPLKSPGPDNIFPAMLQHNNNNVLDILARLFQTSLKLKYIPKDWRKVQVICIPKPGKSNYSLAENFRPLSLSSFMLETLEKLIDRYLRGEPLSH